MLLQDGERHAGASGDLGGQAVDFADAVEPAEAQHDLTVERDRAADQSGVAALGHDGDVLIVAKLHDGCDFFGRPGSHHRGSLATEPAGPIDRITIGDFGVGEDVALAHDGREPVERDHRVRESSARIPASAEAALSKVTELRAGAAARGDCCNR